MEINKITIVRQGPQISVLEKFLSVIDGLGPIKAKDHSEDEYIDKQSLYDRTLLFAHMLAGI